MHHGTLLVSALVLVGGCQTPPMLNDGPKRNERVSAFGSLARQQSTKERRSEGDWDDTSLTRVDKSVWRTSLPPSTAFQMLSRLLSQSYIISSADRRHLTITTEWDKFFIDGRLFRNRLSATVFPLASRTTEIVFRNNVEYYSGSKEKGDDLRDSNWLPTQDVTDEVPRLVDALARQSSQWARGQAERPR